MQSLAVFVGFQPVNGPPALSRRPCGRRRGGAPDKGAGVRVPPSWLLSARRWGGLLGRFGIPGNAQRHLNDLLILVSGADRMPSGTFILHMHAITWDEPDPVIEEVAYAPSRNAKIARLGLG